MLWLVIKDGRSPGLVSAYQLPATCGGQTKTYLLTYSYIGMYCFRHGESKHNFGRLQRSR